LKEPNKKIQHPAEEAIQQSRRKASPKIL